MATPHYADNATRESISGGISLDLTIPNFTGWNYYTAFPQANAIDDDPATPFQLTGLIRAISPSNSISTTESMHTFSTLPNDGRPVVAKMRFSLATLLRNYPDFNGFLAMRILQIPGAASPISFQGNDRLIEWNPGTGNLLTGIIDFDIIGYENPAGTFNALQASDFVTSARIAWDFVLNGSIFGDSGIIATADLFVYEGWVEEVPPGGDTLTVLL